ncbi:MAG: outer membrane protein assembly factor BamD, partial [Candidatus Thorarchaeota archaeon]
AEKFEKIDEEFSLTEYGLKSEIMSAYCYYKAKDYDDSLRIIDYFISFYPLDENMSYMYYLRSMNYYDQIQSVKRSQQATKLAHRSFTELIKKFPKSKYAEDAKIKIEEINDYLAGAEMYIALSSMKKGHYIRALNSFNYIISNYNESKYVPEAYYRIIETYISLGMNEEANNIAKILEDNYPESRWLKYAQKAIDKTR